MSKNSKIQIREKSLVYVLEIAPELILGFIEVFGGAFATYTSSGFSIFEMGTSITKGHDGNWLLQVEIPESRQDMFELVLITYGQKREEVSCEELLESFQTALREKNEGFSNLVITPELRVRDVYSISGLVSFACGLEEKMKIGQIFTASMFNNPDLTFGEVARAILDRMGQE